MNNCLRNGDTRFRCTQHWAIEIWVQTSKAKGGGSRCVAELGMAIKDLRSDAEGVMSSKNQPVQRKAHGGVGVWSRVRFHAVKVPKGGRQKGGRPLTFFCGHFSATFFSRFWSLLGNLFLLFWLASMLFCGELFVRVRLRGVL